MNFSNKLNHLTKAELIDKLARPKPCPTCHIKAKHSHGEMAVVVEPVQCDPEFVIDPDEREYILAVTQGLRGNKHEPH